MCYPGRVESIVLGEEADHFDVEVKPARRRNRGLNGFSGKFVPETQGVALGNHHSDVDCLVELGQWYAARWPDVAHFQVTWRQCHGLDGLPGRLTKSVNPRQNCVLDAGRNPPVAGEHLRHVKGAASRGERNIIGK